jgi:hypothetical protein
MVGSARLVLELMWITVETIPLRLAGRVLDESVELRPEAEVIWRTGDDRVP